MYNTMIMDLLVMLPHASAPVAGPITFITYKPAWTS